MDDKRLIAIRWAPVAGALLLVLLIAAVCVITVKELNEAISWRKHTFQVLLEAQATEDDLLNAEGDIRHFAAQGKPELLIRYQNDTNAELKEFNKLSDLTRDNPEEQARLKKLDGAIKAVFELDNRIVSLYARQGHEAAVKMEESGSTVLDSAISDLENFKSEEKKLLEQRDAAEQNDFHRAVRALIAGSLLVTTLLVLANHVAGREMARRRVAEAKQRELINDLQNALAEVKTLSGLIPICAWCKSVRSDQGFWHSVEHYVTTHTGATFTHGMCPACVAKWSADEPGARA